MNNPLTNGKTERSLFRWLAVSCLVLCGFFALFIVLSFSPPGAEIVCNRAIDSAIQQWQLENATNGYPNVRGEGQASLANITNYIGTLVDYNYIPGLKENDPQHLVLLYINKPCRRYKHGHVWSPLRPERWVVLPIGGGGEFELAEALKTSEFKLRMEETLVFVETNRRPHWETILREHRTFLKSIRD